MLTPAGDKAKHGPSLGAAGPASSFSDRMLGWYDRNRRDLPWRAAPGAAPDPYGVWLSEIMLQQTGVTTVGRYFTAFLTKWPTVASLAAAPAEDVMRAWAGLGYYQRARNLHACAQAIAADHDEQFPPTEAQLRRLPGIGAYASAAIAAIAFGQRAVVIDGNVERVICRFFAVETPAQKAKRQIRRLADSVTPTDRPGDFAQAMMDLGAIVCTPRRPACPRCPLQANCQGFKTGAPEDFPRKLPKSERPVRSGALFYIRGADSSILVRSRPATGLLGGMTEIPGTEWLAATRVPRRCPPLPPALAGFDRQAFRAVPGHVRHVFTHFTLVLTVFVASLTDPVAAPPGCRWVAETALDEEALPTLMRKAVAHAQGAPRPGARA
jgi:A/G-specific adenine glycosylase